MSHIEFGVAAAPRSAVLESSWGWFCLRSKLRQEHIAASQLRQMEVEVLNPRIRFKRRSPYGPFEVTEAMFPGYLFARFDLGTSLARVRYAWGVHGVVHFGPRWPKVPDEVIEQIRATLGPAEIRVVAAEPVAGDRVRVAGGALHGLEAVITQVLPCGERVKVLMDFLGQQATVELETSCLTPAEPRA